MPVSVEGNYCATLWEAWDSDSRAVLFELFGNHRDLLLVLVQDFSGEGEGRCREAAEANFVAFPDLKHSLPGDASRFTQSDIDAFHAGGLDVRR